MSKFVCQDVLPPRRNSSARAIMYGGWEGAENHPKRICSICGTRPILFHVGWKGFCAGHKAEAKIEAAKRWEIGWASWFAYKINKYIPDSQ